ncbi:MAG: maleylpyruvate isomerase N-terminal domain-containing protein [Geodermatophilaceae bacterium]|nr:maleylpyruvate isomerase N-terminal domain-containing protein [Geodermatophilaceae bacterium]
MTDDDNVALYLDAAHTFVELVERIAPDQWAQPGLGSWDTRSLVGHTSRAMVTVLTYVDQPADTEDIQTPEGYYALIATQQTDPQAVAERGRQAGDALGADPTAAVRDLQTRVTERLRHADPAALITTIAGGMRLDNYLPTRTFELVVHSLDISAATGLDVVFAPEVINQAVALAACVAVALGQGPALLTAMTGRTSLPVGFSVVGGTDASPARPA